MASAAPDYQPYVGPAPAAQKQAGSGTKKSAANKVVAAIGTADAKPAAVKKKPVRNFAGLDSDDTPSNLPPKEALMVGILLWNNFCASLVVHCKGRVSLYLSFEILALCHTHKCM